MKKLLFCFSLLVFSFSLCEGQSWVWGSGSKPYNSFGFGDVFGDHSIAVDASGNVFATGVAVGRLIIGVDTLTQLSGGENEFLIKYNTTGTVSWIKQPIATNPNGQCDPITAALDNKDNIYLAGDFTYSFIFPSATLTSKGSSHNAFITKYDSAGNELWAKQAILPSAKCNGYAYGAAVDKSGNSYFVGTFYDTISFGTYTLRNSKTHIFLVKYDPNGNVIWAAQDSSSGRVINEANSIAADNSGGVYITGYFKDTLSFGAFTLYAGSNEAAFLAKYDSSGHVLWVKQSVQGRSNTVGNSHSIAIDGSGDIYITGYFSDTIIFGGVKLPGPSGSVFLVKYSPNGNVLWGRQGYSTVTHSWDYFSLVCDTLSQGGGYLEIVADGPPYQLYFGSDTFSLKTSHQTSTTIMEFDSAGKNFCGTMFTEGDEDDGDAIGVSPAGDFIYFWGDILDTAVFGPDTLMGFYGAEGTFVARWQPCNNIETSINLISNKPSISLFPNPSTGAFTLEVKSEELRAKSVEIYNVMGQKVTPTLLPQNRGGVSVSYQINMGAAPSGVYLYRVIDETGKLLGEGKFVIEK